MRYNYKPPSRHPDQDSSKSTGWRFSGWMSVERDVRGCDLNRLLPQSMPYLWYALWEEFDLAWQRSKYRSRQRRKSTLPPPTRNYQSVTVQCLTSERRSQITRARQESTESTRLTTVPHASHLVCYNTPSTHSLSMEGSQWESNP